MPEEDYMSYFHEFAAGDYDPRAWIRAAKNAGMRYAMLTARHHDGFCLFDSAYTDFKSTNTKPGRDVGPDAHGNIPRQSLEILQEIGCWMHRKQCAKRKFGAF